jgi:hypothetical protein
MDAPFTSQATSLQTLSRLYTGDVSTSIISTHQTPQIETDSRQSGAAGQSVAGQSVKEMAAWQKWLVNR